MARFKAIHKSLKLLPVDFDRQVIPGSFEHALCHLVDHELDLSGFRARYKNDVDGASAYDPAVLIKIILLAYRRGVQPQSSLLRCCLCASPACLWPPRPDRTRDVTVRPSNIGATQWAWQIATPYDGTRYVRLKVLQP